MSHIYRVFLSSTGKDLADHRRKVFEALQRKPDVKVVRMEDFVAEPGNPKDICAREVRASDIFVGLIGFCYGSSPPRFRRSFTHLEYDEAVAEGRSCLMHIAPENVPFPAHTREPDELHERITRFRAKLLKTHTVGQRSAWDSAEALATHVSESVERELNKIRASAEPGFTRRKHELNLKDRLSDIVALLQEEGAARDLLLAEKAAVEEKLRDLESSYAEAKAKIAELEDLLAREGNELGADRLAEAHAALEQGDFSKADALFAEIEARQQMAVQSAARAAYGRGEIAEQQVRWTDAAEHYSRAARLEPSFAHLKKASDYSERAGRYEEAAGFSKQMIGAARCEFGDETEQHADALNEHAINSRRMGRYDEAEPLYRQALEIDEKTIGTAHPDYAARLNNLALLLQDTGRHDKAEPLFRQAIEIGEKTIGTAHPDYATHLNNLAWLLRDMGRHDEAEPLFRQAIEIDAKTIGTAHPDYAIRLNNLAGLLWAMKRHDEAEPLIRQALEIFRAALGPDHPHTRTVEANYAAFLRKRDAGAPE